MCFGMFIQVLSPHNISEQISPYSTPTFGSAGYSATSPVSSPQWPHLRALKERFRPLNIILILGVCFSSSKPCCKQSSPTKRPLMHVRLNLKKDCLNSSPICLLLPVNPPVMRSQERKRGLLLVPYLWVVIWVKTTYLYKVFYVGQSSINSQLSWRFRAVPSRGKVCLHTYYFFPELQFNV